MPALPKMILKIRNSLQSKFMLLILFVTVVPLMLLGYFLYNKSAQTINEQFGQYGENSVHQLQFQIDSMLGRMKYTVDDILSYLLDPTFTVLHEEIPSTYKGLQDEQLLEQFIKAHKTLDTKGIFIITKSGYYYGERTILVEPLQRDPMYRRSNRSPYAMGIYEPQHYNKHAYVPGEKVIGLLFHIKNQTGVLEEARILMELKADKLLDLFKEFEVTTGSMLKITDGAGRVLYQTKAEAANPRLVGVEQGNIARPDDIVWTKSLNETDWRIEVRMPYTLFYKSTLMIRTFTYTAVSLSVLIAVFLAYFISSGFLRRIRRMKESIHMVSIGNLETRIPVNSDDEIGRLSYSFNSMLHQLKSLFSEVKRVERAKKEAELRAFHYQINPHLLINTLNSIQWKARLQGAQDVNKMIHHLTMVLDGNLNYKKEIVTLEQELDVIDHFLKIQELRYGEVFTYSIVNQGVHLSQVEIPRMTLQPLIENIFFHGFEDGQGNIELMIDRESGDVRVQIKDNGKGAEEHVLLDRLKPPDDGKGTKQRIGMYNVDQRIKLHFGSQYGLSVSSRLGRGTTVTIRLPEQANARHSRFLVKRFEEVQG